MRQRSDKAYADGIGEEKRLLRPIKRGERAWRFAHAPAKAHNAALSKIRVRIEHGFARLKAWKVRSGLFPDHWTRLGDVVQALAVVHNTKLAVAAGEL
ncbi:transposase family protein [Cupriavidus basilensis]|uniref:transposase family protein n=1 Tax=unclassified Cupriavidus TaxID=2640874 RepID=UPI00126938BC|nr:transposase family protein [Cupriavidus sp. SK-3]